MEKMDLKYFFFLKTGFIVSSTLNLLLINNKMIQKNMKMKIFEQK